MEREPEGQEGASEQAPERETDEQALEREIEEQARRQLKEGAPAPADRQEPQDRVLDGARTRSSITPSDRPRMGWSGDLGAPLRGPRGRQFVGGVATTADTGGDGTGHECLTRRCGTPWRGPSDPSTGRAW